VWLKDILKENLGLLIDEKQDAQFRAYYDFLIEYNKKTNLTRITDEREAVFKHFYDSLLLTRSLDFLDILSMCDMGSGAGFPGIPIKIAFPHINLTLIDSLGKRVRFLDLLVDHLGLTSVEVLSGRIEDVAKKRQRAFDLVTARALGHTRIVSEMGLPMVKTKGHLIIMKGNSYQEELDESRYTITRLGGKIKDIQQEELPEAYGTRVQILITKERHVPGYPRSYAHMKKKCLTSGGDHG
jgi:16S rRNA (guanine527-N7)-methyltransferase